MKGRDFDYDYIYKQMEEHVAQVKPEDSVLCQIQDELQSQTYEMRKNAATQEINRNHDKVEAERNDRKKFYQSIMITVGSAILGAVLSNIDRILLFFGFIK